MIPTGKNDEEEDKVSASLRHFSKLFGLGRQSKHIKLEIANRKAFNRYLDHVGAVELDERVSCVGSNDATIIGMGDNGSLNIQLHPYESVIKYKNSGQAKVLQWQPALNN